MLLEGRVQGGLESRFVCHSARKYRRNEISKNLSIVTRGWLRIN